MSGNNIKLFLIYIKASIKYILLQGDFPLKWFNLAHSSCKTNQYKLTVRAFVNFCYNIIVSLMSWIILTTVKLTVAAACLNAGQSILGIMRAVNSGLKSTSFFCTVLAYNRKTWLNIVAPSTDMICYCWMMFLAWKTGKIFKYYST